MKLEARGLSVRYGEGGSSLLAVDSVDLALQAGKTLGLVGESGCGKSTVAKAIVGLVPMTGGTLHLDGVDFTQPGRRNGREFRRRVQMIFQDPYSSLDPRMTVGEMLVEAMTVHGILQHGRREAEAIRTLDLVGLSARDLHRYPHQFSGGQRQRIAIARALSVRPEVLINDEVTSALDVSVQATILNLLRDLQKELQLSYVFISHDLSTVRYMSDDVAVMYLGRIVEAAPTDELFARPDHPYSQALINSVPQLRAERKGAPLSGDLPDPRRPPVGCRFHTRCPVGPVANPERTVCLERDPDLDRVEKEHLASCHFAPPTAQPSQPSAAAAGQERS